MHRSTLNIITPEHVQVSIYTPQTVTPLDDFILKSALKAKQVHLSKKLRQAILIEEFALAHEELNNPVCTATFF